MYPRQNGGHCKRGPGWLPCFRSVCLTRPGNRKAVRAIKVHQGMDRKQAEKVARRIGAVVLPVRRSGETKFIFPSGRRLKANARRKDASLALVKAILDETR